MAGMRRVLVACEYSGVIREAFARRGWDAWSCDILPMEQPGQHIQGDVREVFNDGWDLMVAHPPCQYLAWSGIRHWNAPGRAEKREAAAAFFMECVNAPIPRICIENSRGIMSQWYRKPDMEIHPYMFGDPTLKRTCLWLKNLPPLWYWDKPSSLFEMTSVPLPEPTSIDPPDAANPNKKRWFVDGTTRDPHERSRTFSGIAEAMASQWTELEITA